MPLLLLPLLPLLLAGAAGCAGDATFQRDSNPVVLLDGPPGSDAGDATPADTQPPPREGGSTPDTQPADSTPPDQPAGSLVPPAGGSSNGSGGSAADHGKTRQAGSTSYILLVPQSYNASKASRAMVVISGTEGMTVMANNLNGLAGQLGLGDVIFAVIDGPATFGNGQACAAVLDDVRARFNVDNDRTYLLSESAGTRAGLSLGLSLRQSYFAAYWANDVNASATPAKSAAQLGFSPWGNAGPGGALATATAIVNGMKSAGYRLPADAPYSGSGSTQHGNPQQFIAALQFFRDKSRQ
ncbi:MAG: hypothetical protein KC503_38050 [Myxococcales bacterium]|nr:hypothetical protein [Myxococcales bacterium]